MASAMQNRTVDITALSYLLEPSGFAIKHALTRTRKLLLQVYTTALRFFAINADLLHSYVFHLPEAGLHCTLSL